MYGTICLELNCLALEDRLYYHVFVLQKINIVPSQTKMPLSLCHVQIYKYQILTKSTN
jgi:hypothetical protein